MTEPSRNPLRRVLRELTHGVYVLGVRENARDDYLVVALVMQCSVEPPRLVFALDKTARVLHALRETHGCTIALLDHAQRSAVKRYGAPGGIRALPESPMRSAVGEHPVAPESTGWLALRIVQELDVGDHLLFIADVVEAGGEMTVGEIPVAFQPMTLAASKLPYAG